MKLKTIGTQIARRDLDLKGGKKVTVTLGKPRKLPRYDDYYCPFQIKGIRHSIIRYACGVDAFQAILLAMKMIGTILYTSEEAKAGILSWKAGRKGELGFPVSASIRDLVPKSID